MQKNKYAKILPAILILSTVILLLGTLFSLNAAVNCDNNGGLKQSIAYLDGKINENDTIISNIWPWFGYYFNINVESTWDNNITNLIDINKPKYIVYSNFGMEYNQTILDTNKQLTLDLEINDSCNQKIRIYRVTYENQTTA